MNSVGDYVIEVEPQQDLPYFEPNVKYGASKRPMLYVEEVSEDPAWMSPGNPKGIQVVLTVHRSRAQAFSTPGESEDSSVDCAPHVQRQFVMAMMGDGHNILLPPELVPPSDGGVSEDVAQEKVRAASVKSLLDGSTKITQGSIYEVCLSDGSLRLDDLPPRQLAVSYKNDKALIGFGAGTSNAPLYVEDIYHNKLLSALPPVVQFSHTSRVLEQEGDGLLSDADAIEALELTDDKRTLNPGRLVFPEGEIAPGAVVDVLCADGAARGVVEKFVCQGDVFLSVNYERDGAGTNMHLGVGITREVIQMGYDDLRAVIAPTRGAAVEALGASDARPFRANLEIKAVPVSSRTKEEWQQMYQETPMTSVAAAEKAVKTEQLRVSQEAQQSDQYAMAM